MIKNVELKTKINKDLNEGKVPYAIIEKMLQYEYGFLEKIKVIVDFKNNEAKKIMDKIKK